MKACPPQLGQPLPAPHYAELHFAPQGRRLSRLWQPWPEIYLDLPWRVEAGDRAPLLLVAADAARWPVDLLGWRVSWLDPRGRLGTLELPGGQQLSGQVDGVVIGELPVDEPGSWEVWIDGVARRRGGGAEIHFRNQLARGFAEEPLRLRVDPGPLPGAPGRLRGDPHVHSTGTRDMIEFGPPPELLRRAAQALGLGWFALTDHSYDLDDASDSCWRSDPALPRWREQQAWITASREGTGAFVLPGEECSVGAPGGGVLHLLLLAPPRFVEGAADSGERLLPGRSRWPLAELLADLRDSGCLPVAAHTGERPSRGERLLLRRRAWTAPALAALPAQQAISGGLGASWERGRALWIQSLRTGARPALLAGSDSHGHFSLARSLRVPGWSVETRRRGLFGRYTSAPLLPPEAAAALPAGGLSLAEAGRLQEILLAALASGDVLCGDGPLVGFRGAAGDWRCGGPCDSFSGWRLAWEAATGAGALRELRLFGGDAGGERLLGTWTPDAAAGERGLPASAGGCDWLRAELLQADGWGSTGAFWRGA
jgi:hypothetical protein